MSFITLGNANKNITCVELTEDGWPVDVCDVLWQQSPADHTELQTLDRVARFCYAEWQVMLGALDQMYASYELSYPDQPETDSNLSIYEASTSKVSWNVLTSLTTSLLTNFNLLQYVTSNHNVSYHLAHGEQQYIAFVFLVTAALSNITSLRETEKTTGFCWHKF